MKLEDHIESKRMLMMALDECDVIECALSELSVLAYRQRMRVELTLATLQGNVKPPEDQ